MQNIPNFINTFVLALKGLNMLAMGNAHRYETIKKSKPRRGGIIKYEKPNLLSIVYIFYFMFR